MRELIAALYLAILFVLIIRTAEDPPPQIEITNAAAPLAVEPRVDWTYCERPPAPIPLIERKA